jgi:release factor glutamine methyltransferase
VTPLEPPRTVVDFLGLASAYLAARALASPRLDAEILLGHALGLQRLELYLQHDRPLEPAEVDAFRDLLRRRGGGEPVAYLIGTWGFRSLVLKTDRRALVPRPESEVLVELALARLPAGGTLLDLGTGSGAIALAVTRERPDAAVTGVDLDDDALALARENAARLDLAPRLIQSDLYDGLPGGERFDVIVGNLPYVADDDSKLDAAVRDHEPHRALFGGADGLDLVRRALVAAPDRLNEAGTILLELGEGQAPRVQTIAREAGAGEVEIAADLAGIDRYVVARWSA